MFIVPRSPFSLNSLPNDKMLSLSKPSVCLGFYAGSAVFQLLNGDSSQIHVSWTIFNQYLITPVF